MAAVALRKPSLQLHRSPPPSRLVSCHVDSQGESGAGAPASH